VKVKVTEQIKVKPTPGEEYWSTLKGPMLKSILVRNKLNPGPKTQQSRAIEQDYQTTSLCCMCETKPG